MTAKQMHEHNYCKLKFFQQLQTLLTCCKPRRHLWPQVRRSYCPQRRLCQSHCGPGYQCPSPTPALHRLRRSDCCSTSHPAIGGMLRRVRRKAPMRVRHLRRISYCCSCWSCACCVFANWAFVRMCSVWRRSVAFICAARVSTHMRLSPLALFCSWRSGNPNACSYL